MRDAITVDGPRMTLNYGLNRVRFVSPVPSGSRIRARVALAAIDDMGDSIQATWGVTIEREGGDKPAVVAEWIVRYYPGAAWCDCPRHQAGSRRRSARLDPPGGLASRPAAWSDLPQFDD